MAGMHTRSNQYNLGDRGVYIGGNVYGSIFTGDHNQQYANNNPAELYFLKIDLDEYSSTSYPPPNNIDNVIEKIKNDRVLVFFGDSEIGWRSLLMHIAWQLKDKINQQLVAKQLDTQARSDESSLLRFIRVANDEPTIFLLFDIGPEDVNYDLQQIQELINEQNNYLLIFSNIPGHEWKRRSNITLNWLFEISPDSLYTQEQLVTFLQGELKIYEKETEPKLKRLVTILRTKQTIRTFAQTQGDKLKKILNNNSELDNLIDELKRDSIDKKVSVKKTRFQQLQLREQLLVIGLAFFSDLYSDQFFPALDNILLDKWRIRYPQVHAYDIHDLSFVSNFYEETRSKQKGQIQLSCDYKTIFNFAWETHRHYILSALPILTEQVLRATRKHKSKSAHLYRDNSRRELIRSAVRKSFTQLGYKDGEIVKDEIIKMAAQRHYSLQISAGKIVADWREIDSVAGLQKVINFIEYLTQEKNFRDLIANLEDILGREFKHSAVKQNIEATAALILGYAAKYDPPHKLDQELKSKFIYFLNRLDSNKILYDRMATYVVPQIVKRHWQILEFELIDLAKKEKFLDGIAKGLASSYLTFPIQVKQKIDEWAGKANQELNNSDPIYLLPYLKTHIRFNKIKLGDNVFNSSTKKLSLKGLAQSLYVTATYWLELFLHPFGLPINKNRTPNNKDRTSTDSIYLFLYLKTRIQITLDYFNDSKWESPAQKHNWENFIEGFNEISEYLTKAVNNQNLYKPVFEDLISVFMLVLIQCTFDEQSKQLWIKTYPKLPTGFKVALRFSVFLHFVIQRMHMEANEEVHVHINVGEDQTEILSLPIRTNQLNELVSIYTPFEQALIKSTLQEKNPILTQLNFSLMLNINKLIDQPIRKEFRMFKDNGNHTPKINLDLFNSNFLEAKEIKLSWYENLFLWPRYLFIENDDNTLSPFIKYLLINNKSDLESIIKKWKGATSEEGRIFLNKITAIKDCLELAQNKFIKLLFWTTLWILGLFLLFELLLFIMAI